MEDSNRIKLVFPTEEHREQVEEFLQEHFDNNEFELHGSGGLDRLKDFDIWFEKVKNDLSKELSEKDKRVPATVFLAIRKSDNRIVGIIQIRHKLNEKLLKDCGHIGDGIRPSERKKGYATEMIRLALEECKKIGIKRVLMVCYKDNIGSRKSIQNNGGILENEIVDEEGKTIQRYWISLKKKFATMVNKFSNVLEVSQTIKSINNEDFVGDIFLNDFKNISYPYILDSGICIQDTNYKWLEFYDYTSKVRLTAIYNEKNEIVEWYFDMARSIGKEDGIPYEDDLYLDVVLRPDGKTILLDEDEFKDAFNRLEFTKEEYQETYKIAYNLIEKVKENQIKVKAFTDKYLKEML